ncbi:hypothetical protein NC653_032466 [Populus alba x Populus x berolinensis]|uniref:Uncharacterized protein n=1 Tax=Populus alba x Populus x berolinensis TaxID=444605 RepID=A0AAD6LRD1_9ROSI|nr:hypothetical protein NC653_032466 [Populus alba x Populus x berolinensis]
MVPLSVNRFIFLNLVIFLDNIPFLFCCQFKCWFRNVKNICTLIRLFSTVRISAQNILQLEIYILPICIKLEINI